MDILELFSCFNVDCRPRGGLELPINAPLWTFKTKTDRSRYTGETPVDDLASHLPGQPGSKERIEFLATYYGRQTNEISPFE